MFRYPYGKSQQLNLDWFLRKFKELVAAWNAKEESIDGALDDEIQRAEDALDDVFTARDVTVAAKNDTLVAKADALTASANAATAAANAAQYWQNAANSAQSAATSALTALQAAQDASADAAQVAADKATVAQDKATVAQDKATVAADAAQVAQDKADTDDIKDAANAAALRAEGYAGGTQNGTSVTSGSPYFENNAKYYSEIRAALSPILFFDDFSYTNDGTIITMSSQQQLVFAKNKINLTRLGTSTTYYMVSLFGNHAITSGSPISWRTEDLVQIPTISTDMLTDIVFICKTKNHTSTETNTPSVYFGTYDQETDSWEQGSVVTAAANELTRTRTYSMRKYLPNAFVNGNFTVALRIRAGSTMDIEYSIIYNYNYYNPIT